ncbi:MAG: CARDB domain-containing protein [Candidatus Micrarchaeaceae archaeon]
MRLGKEAYLWIAFVIVVIAVAVYLRYYFSSAISIKVGLAPIGLRPGSVVYPGQQLFYNLSVNNTGTSPVQKLGLDFEVNGNTTNVFDVSIPPGKSAHAVINYTPKTAGLYNLTVIADPGKLYDIRDRASAAASVSVLVTPLESPDAYLSLPPGKVAEISTDNLDPLGFLFYSDLAANYGMQRFNMTGLPGLAKFAAALEYLVSYTYNMSVARAIYRNGSAAYAIWLNPGPYRNLLPANIVGVAAEGINLSASSYTVGNISVTLVKLPDNESLCSWNSGGWIKIVASAGAGSCPGAVGDNSTQFAPRPISGVKLVPPLVPGFVVGNETLSYGNVLSEGYTAIFNQTLDFASVTENLTNNNYCMGQINTAGNVSYCSTLVIPYNGSESAPYLINTRAQVGPYNLTLLWRTNSPLITSLIPEGIDVLEGYNASGKPVEFANGIPPQCSVPGFACTNVTMSNSTLSLRLANLYSSPLKIDSVGCVFLGPTTYTKVNKTVQAYGIANVSTKCYNDGSVVTSLPTALVFTLRLNYTAANTLHSVNGSIYVVG